MSCNPFCLRQLWQQGVSVINIFYKCHCSNDDPGFLCFYNRTFVPKFIFLCLFPFGNALYMWLVYTVDFVTAVFPLCQYFIENREQCFVFFFFAAIHLPVNVPDNPAGDNFYPARSRPGFLFAPGMAVKALVQSSIVLTHACRSVLVLSPLCWLFSCISR